MRQWEERGYGQGRKKKKTKDIAKRFEKKLAQVERVEKPWVPWRLELALVPGRRSGDVVARLEGAVVERGRFTLGPIDLEVRSGDRLVVLGRNGAGKTTLLRALLGELPLAAGRRWIGPGVVLGDLPQGGGVPSGERSLLDLFLEESSLEGGVARTLLAKFALGADHVLRPARSLSPGERSRATLALQAARGVNALVLDEPTNHLDLEAIVELESALEHFAGTAVLVSHDRRFLDAFGATRTLALRSRYQTRARRSAKRRVRHRLYAGRRAARVASTSLAIWATSSSSTEDGFFPQSLPHLDDKTLPVEVALEVEQVGSIRRSVPP